jgi:HTH-type transcriptional regulator/antitoxin HipB
VAEDWVSLKFHYPHYNCKLLLTSRNVCYRFHFEKNTIAYIMNITLRTPADIGALIRDRRRALGLDQAELADRIGVSRLWVNQVERGKPGASLGLILRALIAVGVELTGGVADKKPLGDSAPVASPDIDAIIVAARRKDRS